LSDLDHELCSGVACNGEFVDIPAGAMGIHDSIFITLIRHPVAAAPPSLHAQE
jgi:hypothetical protein